MECCKLSCCVCAVEFRGTIHVDSKCLSHLCILETGNIFVYIKKEGTKESVPLLIISLPEQPIY